MNIYVVPISSACSLKDMQLEKINPEEDIQIRFVENKEYRFLTALPLCEDGDFMPVCSKDGKEWHHCAGAFDLDGNIVDLEEFRKLVRERAVSVAGG